MARQSLVTMVADDLLDRIVRGEWRAGDALPTESEIGLTHDVSRVTVREALRLLQAQEVVAVRAGRGTFVNPVDEWTGIEAVLRVTRHDSGADDVSLQLVEVRRMLECGAAALAATRRGDEVLADLRTDLQVMRDASTAFDVQRFVAADISFHDVILRATGNVFLPVLFAPLARVMHEKRTQTSSVPDIRTHAILHHSAILEAISSGDPSAAWSAMDAHMTQTEDDIRAFRVDS